MSNTFWNGVLGNQYNFLLPVLYNLHLYCLLIIILLLSATAYTFRTLQSRKSLSGHV